MARTRFSFSTDGETALAANVWKTVLQIASLANVGVAVRGVAVSFDGVSGSAEPAEMELLIQTSAGTMTPATARHDDRRITAMTPVCTLQKNATAEPTDSGEVLRDNHVHPQTGVEFRWWLDEELVVGGAGVVRLGLRIKLPAGATAVNCRARMYCEE